MYAVLKSAAKFSFAFFVMTIVCTITWEIFVDTKLYNCPGEGLMDYLAPGDWVHDKQGQPMQIVSQVVLGRSMSEPDMIKEGWTVTRLWYLWYSFFATSVVISTVLTFVPWIPRRFNWHS